METQTIEVDLLAFDESQLCSRCGVAHQPDMPHAMTGQYEMQFQQEHGRMPTFEDTIAHCGPDLKRAFEQALRQQAYYRCFEVACRVVRNRHIRDNRGGKLYDLTDLIIAHAEGRWP